MKLPLGPVPEGRTALTIDDHRTSPALVDASPSTSKPNGAVANTEGLQRFAIPAEQGDGRVIAGGGPDDLGQLSRIESLDCRRYLATNVCRHLGHLTAQELLTGPIPPHYARVRGLPQQYALAQCHAAPETPVPVRLAHVLSFSAAVRSATWPELGHLWGARQRAADEQVCPGSSDTYRHVGNTAPARCAAR